MQMRLEDLFQGGHMICTRLEMAFFDIEKGRSYGLISSNILADSLS